MEKNALLSSSNLCGCVASSCRRI